MTIDSPENYYFNPWTPYGVIIATSHCPCQDQVITKYVVNYNYLDIVNYDGGPIIDAIQYEINFEI